MKRKLSTVTTKDQCLIPSKLRHLRSFRGSLKRQPSALKALLEERRHGRKV